MATKKSIGFADIQRQFDTENVCRDYLFNLSWPNGFYVPSVDALSIITLQHGISTHVKTAGIRHL